MGVQFPGKKRYVTLEWPLTDMACHYLLYKDRSYCMGSAGINSELEIKLDNKCPISTVAVKFPIFARICHTIYKHINV